MFRVTTQDALSGRQQAAEAVEASLDGIPLQSNLTTPEEGSLEMLFCLSKERMRYFVNVLRGLCLSWSVVWQKA